MSGYTGNPDAEAEQALIINENGIHASRMQLEGPVYTECQNCGDDIPEARVLALKRNGMKCMYCIGCQDKCNRAPKIKMLDRIL